MKEHLMRAQRAREEVVDTCVYCQFGVRLIPPSASARTGRNVPAGRAPRSRRTKVSSAKSGGFRLTMIIAGREPTICVRTCAGSAKYRGAG